MVRRLRRLAAALRFGTPPEWRAGGEEPDYRFSLANERTFLAWLRTALALMAGAVAIVQLVPTFAVPGARKALGILLAITACALAGWAYPRWAAIEAAMRSRRPLPHTPLLGWLATVLVVAGVVLLALVAAS